MMDTDDTLFDVETFLATEHSILRVLFWLRYPHHYPPRCLQPYNDLSTNEKLDFIISVVLDNSDFQPPMLEPP